jgi:hypothetical protein
MLLWVVRPCRPVVGRYQRFGETYCLHLQGFHIHFNIEDVDSMFQRNVDMHMRVYTASQPRTSSSITL